MLLHKMQDSALLMQDPFNAAVFSPLPTPRFLTACLSCPYLSSLPQEFGFGKGERISSFPPRCCLMRSRGQRYTSSFRGFLCKGRLEGTTSSQVTERLRNSVNTQGKNAPSGS